MTVAMNQPTNSITLTMNSCKIFQFKSSLLQLVTTGELHYLETLGDDHGPGLPVSLAGSHHQGQTGQEDEDGGQDGVGHDGWLEGWLGGVH